MESTSAQFKQVAPVERLPERLTPDEALPHLRALCPTLHIFRNKQALYRACRLQQVPHYRIGSRVYFDTNEVREWLLNSSK